MHYRDFKIICCAHALVCDMKLGLAGHSGGQDAFTIAYCISLL